MSQKVKTAEPKCDSQGFLEEVKFFSNAFSGWFVKLDGVSIGLTKRVGKKTADDEMSGIVKRKEQLAKKGSNVHCAGSDRLIKVVKWVMNVPNQERWV